METHKWQAQSGEDRYSTEIIVKQIGGKLIGLSVSDGAASSEPVVYRQLESDLDIVPF